MVSADITLASELSDWLMLHDSSARSSSEVWYLPRHARSVTPSSPHTHTEEACVRSTEAHRSDPARSTRFSLAWIVAELRPHNSDVESEVCVPCKARKGTARQGKAHGADLAEPGWCTVFSMYTVRIECDRDDRSFCGVVRVHEPPCEGLGA